MIVDDDPSVLYTVEWILGDEGFRTLAVSSGADCLKELRHGFRGLILMDIMMPYMSGWQTIEAILDEGLMDGNVVCMLTAARPPADQSEHLNEHVMDYVHKPFGSDELLSTVNNCLAQVA